MVLISRFSIWIYWMVITLQTCCCGPCFGTLLSGGGIQYIHDHFNSNANKKTCRHRSLSPSAMATTGPLDSILSHILWTFALILTLGQLFSLPLSPWALFFFKSDVKQINISFILMESSFVPSLPLQRIPLFSPLSTTYIKEQFICSVFTFIPTKLISTTTFYPTSALMPTCRLVSHHQ